MKPPNKPAMPTDPQLMFKHHVDTQACDLCHHLVKESKAKLVEWFGKAMFGDLLEKGILPPRITPTEMSEHLKATHGQPKDHRTCMEQVCKAVDTPHDPKAGIETLISCALKSAVTMLNSSRTTSHPNNS